MKNTTTKYRAGQKVTDQYGTRWTVLLSQKQADDAVTVCRYVDADGGVHGWTEIHPAHLTAI